MTATAPPAVPVEGTPVGVHERLRGVESLLVGLDFDGTLAPVADAPDEVRIAPDCRAAVEGLAAHPDASVAVVSGRELSDLRPRVGVDGVAYAGNHGLELDHGDGDVVHPAGGDHRPAVRDAVEALTDRVGTVPGCEIEDKRLTATVHYRRTPPDRVDEVRDAVAAVVDGRDAVRVTAGKRVLEVRPAVEWDKGRAMGAIADRVGGDGRPIYLGDDATDEDAFRAVRNGGVGVLVGTRADTRAGYRLPARADVAPFLAWLEAAVLGESG